LKGPMTLEDYLQQLPGVRGEAIRQFHQENLELINKAHGSTRNHQAWEGGYRGHLTELCTMADKLYQALTEIRPLPFTLESALIVLYFHDIEKMWKYTCGLPEQFNKDEFYRDALSKKFNIRLTNEELTALDHIHGENEAYSNTKRTMNELGAFCHSCDTMSARMWYNYPEPDANKMRA
jgi:hypothetical protein